MTNQSMFDTVWNHFVVGKGKSSLATPREVRVEEVEEGEEREYDVSCLYRDGDGNKCAFGLFIPDELYDPKWEGKPAGRIIEKMRQQGYLEIELETNTQPDYPQSFVKGLQDAHDSAAEEMVYKGTDFHKAIEECLRFVAHRFELTIPTV